MIGLMKRISAHWHARRRRDRSPGRHPCRRPTVEALEERCLLSGITATLSSAGVLHVEGTETADRIIIRQNANLISVDGIRIVADGQSVARVAAAAVTRIEVDARGGNDVVRLDLGRQAIQVPAEIHGGGGSDVLVGGAGGDRISGDDGNDVLRGGAGADTLEGGAGDNWLHGGAGADSLSGGPGLDLLDGGQGFDLFHDDFDLSQPFYNGQALSDVNQRWSYTCQTLASVAAGIRAGYDFSHNISIAGNNLYNVTLFPFGVPTTEAVFFDGTWSDIDPTPAHDAQYRTLPEFWTILLQRARLQYYGVDWQHDLTKAQWDDANLQSGNLLFNVGDAMTMLTDRWVAWGAVPSATPQLLANALADNKLVAAYTIPTWPAAPLHPNLLVGWHCYAVTDVFSSQGRWFVRVYDPFGVDGAGVPLDGKRDGVITMSWNVFVGSFEGYFTA